MEQLKIPPELKLAGNTEDKWKRFKQSLALSLQAMGASEKGGNQM